MNLGRHGFPLPDNYWEKMWRRAEEAYPEIKGKSVSLRGKEVPLVPIARPPVWNVKLDVDQFISNLQQYIEHFTYNHTGSQFFDINKDRPYVRLMETAAEIVREALPIRCLEATLVAMHVTTGVRDLDRFPISFKSVFGTQQHRHIVLGFYFAGRYGALGLSRLDTLMYKAPMYFTLSELIMDYKEAYEEVGHTLMRVRFGSLVSHDPQCTSPQEWRSFILQFKRCDALDAARKIDLFARKLRTGTVINLPPPAPPPRRVAPPSSFNVCAPKPRTTNSIEFGERRRLFDGAV